MAVYVDDMEAKFGRMTMCHMIATTDEELRDMAVKLGISKHHQGNHYDICKSRRKLAISLGAIQIEQRDTVRMTRMQKVTGRMGTPQEAKEWYSGWKRALKKLED